LLLLQGLGRENIVPVRKSSSREPWREPVACRPGFGGAPHYDVEHRQPGVVKGVSLGLWRCRRSSRLRPPWHEGDRQVLVGRERVPSLLSLR